MGDHGGGGVTSHIMTAASRHFQSYPDKQTFPIVPRQASYPERWLISSLVTTKLSTTKLSTAVNSDRTLAYQFDNSSRSLTVLSKQTMIRLRKRYRNRQPQRK